MVRSVLSSDPVYAWLITPRPCPSIDVMQGDRVVVNVYNGLRNESTSLHWHGIHQRGTNHMDGATGSTQCPIAPGQSFRYEWIVSQYT
jgi:iron transport multicopper oxidase